MVGSSGSGKTTLSQHIEKLGVKPLVSFTTRPMRVGEEQGREHWFVSKSEIPPSEHRLAYAFFGGHHYWTHTAQIREGGIYSYVIDEKALVTMIERFGKSITIIPIYIIRKDLTGIDMERLARDEGRIELPESFYNATIVNDGSVGDFLARGEKVIREILEGLRFFDK